MSQFADAQRELHTALLKYPDDRTALLDLWENVMLAMEYTPEDVASVIGECTPPSIDHGFSVRNHNGTWWWADETWDWHGPYAERNAAKVAQNEYVTKCL